MAVWRPRGGGVRISHGASLLMPGMLAGVVRRGVLVVLGLGFTACAPPEGWGRSLPASVRVVDDRETGVLPWPNDRWTYPDSTSPTGLRLNLDPTVPLGPGPAFWTRVNESTGFSLYAPIEIAFDGAIDLEHVMAAHPVGDLDPSDDVVWLVNIDPRSVAFGEHVSLDPGTGEHPVIVDDGGGYGSFDPHAGSWWVDAPPAANAAEIVGDPEHHALVLRPRLPLRPSTRYAVVVTRRLHDAEGAPVGSPFPFAVHLDQHAALAPLLEVLPEGATDEDIAFAFSFTTQAISSSAAWLGSLGSPPAITWSLDLDATDPDWQILLPHLLRETLALEAGSRVEDRLLRAWQEVGMQRMGTFDAAGAAVPFWIAYPRASASESAAAPPVLLLLPDTGRSRLDAMLEWAGLGCEEGYVVASLDLARHGPTRSAEARASFAALLGAASERILGPLLFARGDAALDSGAGTWSGDPWATRDALRTSVLDVMRWVRAVRAGSTGLAPDSRIHVLGVGQGALVASVLSSLDPEVDAIVAVGGAARLADGAFRSNDPIVKAGIAALMGPSVLVAVHPSGITDLFMEVHEGSGLRRVLLDRFVPPQAAVTTGLIGNDVSVQPGDTVLVRGGEGTYRGCAVVGAVTQPDPYVASARVDVSLPRDAPFRVDVFRGAVLDPRAATPCVLLDSQTEPLRAVTQVAVPLDEHGDPILFDGEPIAGRLRMLTDGWALPRTGVGLRTLRGLHQLVLDEVDPGIRAALAQDNPAAGALPRTMIVAPVGNLREPVSQSVAWMRVAGLIDATTMRRLDAAGVLEGIARTRRHLYPTPLPAPEVLEALGIEPHGGVLVDPHGWEAEDDLWGRAVPRDDLPALVSGRWVGVFPYVLPSGAARLPRPGEGADRAERAGLDAPRWDPGSAWWQRIVGFLRDGRTPSGQE